MASTNAPLKVLTVGPAAGSIRELFSKVKAIDAKHGKFDLVLAVGDFFGPVNEENEPSEEIEDLISGRIEVPVETYIMQGDHPLPSSVILKFATTKGDLCKNLFLFSKSAVITTPHGLRIGCLGGAYDAHAYATAEGPLGFSSSHFSRQTLDKLLSACASTSSSSGGNYNSLASIREVQSQSSALQYLDILVSSEWPSSIATYSSLPSPGAASGAPPLDVLVRSSRPRYHFSPGVGEPRIFWEREPYTWESDQQDRVSRFVALGAFGGESLPVGAKKQRWFYAFSIAPVTPNTPPAPRPANATKNPFTEPLPGQKRPHGASSSSADGENYIWGNVQQPGKRARMTPGGGQDKPPPGYQCKICSSAEHFINDCPDRQKPPEGYVCKVCNEPGHFVRDCPTRHAVGDTGGRKPKSGYVCRACGSEEHYLDDCPTVATHRQDRSTGSGGRGERRGKREPVREIQPDECWFCLSNPNLAKYLIVSVGTECYVTLPKGQIIPTHSDAAALKDISSVPGGGHVLIVPIAHYPTFSTVPFNLAGGVHAEVEQHKSALTAYYTHYGARPVFFEIARPSAKKGGHAHVQAVPIPVRIAERVESAFRDAGEPQGIVFEDDPEGALAACADGKKSYFRVDLPDGSKMVHLLQDHIPFGVQWPRQVITELLGVRERTDWKVCAQSEEQDKEDVIAFKSAFAQFDVSDA